jgi:hypothetical protein
MEDLKARLEQVEKNIVSVRTSIDCNLIVISDYEADRADLKKQIADSEVTYSIGDRFKNVNTGTKYLLIYAGGDNVDMVSLKSGCRWMTAIVPKRRGRITTIEMKPLLASFDRYWDARKQEKVS